MPSTSGSPANLLQSFQRVSCFVFDVDGVLTDGTVQLMEDGMQIRTMHVRDGLALQMALKNQYRVIVISGAYSEPVVKRMHYLGVKEIFTAIHDKEAFVEKYMSENNLTWEQILFMGDDLPDLALLKKAGLSCCPSDAAREIQQVSAYISPVAGGKGCVRDVVEKVMRANGQWNFDVSITSR